MSSPASEESADEDIDLGEMTASIGFLLRMAQVQAFDAFYDQLAQFGIKPGEFTVLWIIGLNPEQRQGTIARKLAIKPAHMTKLIQRQVKAGYVNRSVLEGDRRSVRLSLTQEGADFVAKYKNDFLGYHQTERDRLSEVESEHLCRLLRKFAAAGHREN